LEVQPMAGHWWRVEHAETKTEMKMSHSKGE
jgi:hypothetical protein